MDAVFRIYITHDVIYIPLDYKCKLENINNATFYLPCLPSSKIRSWGRLWTRCVVNFLASAVHTEPLISQKSPEHLGLRWLQLVPQHRGPRHRTAAAARDQPLEEDITAGARVFQTVSQNFCQSQVCITCHVKCHLQFLFICSACVPLASCVSHAVTNMTPATTWREPGPLCLSQNEE